MIKRTLVRLSTLAVLLAAATAASAHTGHGTHHLMEGLAHPFGLDHLLAMLAVGVWSASIADSVDGFIAVSEARIQPQ